ncbi:hypothetical protein V7094_29005 [Priestia megaterium]|uniref:hypothetical protein n=1 Tax=Priestia megaterium TaxID=1404 RepID=UPI002FFDBE5F
MEEVLIKLNDKDDLNQIITALGIRQHSNMVVDEKLNDLISRLCQQALELE